MRAAAHLAMRPIFGGILRKHGGWSAPGVDRAPLDGPLIIIANHRSTLDPPFLNFTLKRHVTFMAWDVLYQNPNLARFMRWYGTIPVKPGSADRAALKAAEAVLVSGGAVGIFPEGGVMKEPGVQPLQAGFGLLARRTGAPVIPCGLVNTDLWKPADDKKILPGRHPALIARWGEPRTWDKNDAPEAIAAWAHEELSRLSQP